VVKYEERDRGRERGRWGERGREREKKEVAIISALLNGGRGSGASTNDEKSLVIFNLRDSVTR
jgi:hypothetical protein